MIIKYKGLFYKLVGLTCGKLYLRCIKDNSIIYIEL